MEDIKKAVRPRGTDSAKVIQVIVTESLLGRGTPDDPCRTVVQYWSLDGTPLAQVDPIAAPSEPPHP